MFLGDAYMIFGIVLCAVLWVTLPTLLVTLVAWTLVRQQKPVIGIVVGIGLLVAFMVLFWQYGIFEVERCIQTCISGSPLEACRFSCNLEGSWPFIYVCEFLSLFDILVFLIASNFLIKRSKHHLNLTEGV